MALLVRDSLQEGGLVALQPVRRVGEVPQKMGLVALPLVLQVQEPVPVVVVMLAYFSIQAGVLVACPLNPSVRCQQVCRY